MEKKYFCNSNLSRFCDLGFAIFFILSGIFCEVKYLNWFSILSGSYFFMLFLESFRFIIFENDSITYRSKLLIKRKININKIIKYTPNNSSWNPRIFLKTVDGEVYKLDADNYEVIMVLREILKVKFEKEILQKLNDIKLHGITLNKSVRYDDEMFKIIKTDKTFQWNDIKVRKESNKLGQTYYFDLENPRDSTYIFIPYFNCWFEFENFLDEKTKK